MGGCATNKSKEEVIIKMNKNENSKRSHGSYSSDQTPKHSKKRKSKNED
jgi:hypothetical protein